MGNNTSFRMNLHLFPCLFSSLVIPRPLHMYLGWFLRTAFLRMYIVPTYLGSNLQPLTLLFPILNRPVLPVPAHKFSIVQHKTVQYTVSGRFSTILSGSSSHAHGTFRSLFLPYSLRPWGAKTKSKHKQKKKKGGRFSQYLSSTPAAFRCAEIFSFEVWGNTVQCIFSRAILGSQV